MRDPGKNAEALARRGVLPGKAAAWAAERISAEDLHRLRTLADDAASRAGAILNAALAVLAEHGDDAANMCDMAAPAGVGKAAIGTARLGETGRRWVAIRRACQRGP
jgi:hypothetical protein